MYTLMFAQSQRVLLISYCGPLTGTDIRDLDISARAFIEIHGQVPSIVDLSGVTAISISTEVVKTMGTIAPAMGKEMRAYVAPSDEAFGMVRLYAAHQELAGHPAPRVVRSFAEAIELIGRGDLHFLPLADFEAPATPMIDRAPEARH